MSRRTRTIQPHVRAAIFVEGGDEERLVECLLGKDRVFVQCFDGRDEARLDLVAAATRNDASWHQIERVCVILDAEDDLAGSRELVNRVFAALAWPAPGVCGVAEDHGPRRSGAWLLPDNQAPGASETLLLRTASPTVLACIDSFFACTPNPGTTTARRDKCRAGAMAAALLDKARPDQLWPRTDPQHPELKALRDFLEALDR